MIFSLHSLLPLSQEYTQTSVAEDAFPGTYVVVQVRTVFANRSFPIATHAVTPVVWFVTLHVAAVGDTTIAAGVTFNENADPTVIAF